MTVHTGFRWLTWAAVLLVCPILAAQQKPNYTFRVNSDLVQISVVARDRNGRFVRDLSRDDFLLTEEGRQQPISAIDLETVGTPDAARTEPLPLQLPVLTSSPPVPATAARGLRMVVLFFDFTSLDLPDAARSLRAAEAYVRTIGPDDRVAVVSLAPNLQVQQDFTGDRSQLLHALVRLHGLSQIALGAADDSSYDVFYSYGRLRCLRLLATALARIPQKKSVMIFAGGVPSGSDLVAITATVDAAVRAGVSFYGIDATGLTATPPLGDATAGSSFGTAVLSGTAVVQNSSAIQDQELLYALARGTGGRAFFDSNDFERPFRTLESDTSEYYMLSYRSSNSRADGRYRRVSVRVRRPGIQLKYQAGYYGPRAGSAASARDAERVLQEELAADLPDTDLPVLGSVTHLRLDKGLFYVPITVLLPSEALIQNGSPDSALVGLDVVDDRGHLVRKLRDVIPASAVREHPTWPVHYQTATELSAGAYKLRLVVVQSGTGRAGSFRMPLRLPQQSLSPLSVSPLLSGSLIAAGTSSPKSPLVLNGSRLILNPLAEYGEGRSFTMQYQVECGMATRAKAACDAQQTRSALQCFSSDQRVFKAEPTATSFFGDTAVFRVEFPAGSLRPGTYKCRVTAINSQYGAFAFGATQIRIRDRLDDWLLQAGTSEP
jgi:VWFA-related protein